MGVIDSLKESVLGKEMSLPICSLPQKTPLDIFYTYFDGKPRSHRLEFRKGSRTKFEMFLPRYGEDISQLCSAIAGREYRKTGDETVFGFWPRLALRLTAGKLISCRDICTGPSSEIHTQFGQARSAYRYRLAYCQKGTQEAMILVSSRHGSQSSAYRKGQSTKFNWIKLSLGEYRTLVEHLQLFTGSNEFAKVKEQKNTE
jgi:hypothetical protein